MKGIYLTQEGKQEIEAMIDELQTFIDDEDCEDSTWSSCNTRQSLYKQFLASATILPVEESWYKVIENVENDSQSLILQTPFIMKALYERGVIIQPKS